MKLDKVIKDLEGMKKAGFATCNIQCFLDQLEKVTESVEVDQFIADWYEKYKGSLEYNIWEWMKYPNEPEKKNMKFTKWLNSCDNHPVETLVKMELFGYKVKEDTKYNVKVVETKQILYKSDCDGIKFVDVYNTTQHKKYEFTKKELDTCGMSYVFSGKGFRVEAVEE